MLCMNYGAKLQEEAKFCMNCGMAIGENKSNYDIDSMVKAIKYYSKQTGWD